MAFYYGRSSRRYDDDHDDDYAFIPATQPNYTETYHNAAYPIPPYDPHHAATPLVGSPQQHSRSHPPMTTTTTTTSGPFLVHFDQSHPNQPSQNADDEHTSVQINAIHALNQGRRTFPILALIYLLWNIAEIITLSTVVGLTWGQKCDETTIRIIIIARIIRNAIITPVHLRRVLSIPETDFDMKIQAVSRLSIMFFFIFSQQWLTDGEQCRRNAPALYWTGIGVIVLLYLTILAPLILVLLICTCLPCILTVFRLLNIGDLPTAASNDDIEQLPTFQYDPTTYHDPFSGEAASQQPPQTQPEEFATPKQPATPRTTTMDEAPSAPPLSPTQAKSPSKVQPKPRAQSPKPPSQPTQATPECAICLCEFERGEQLKQLKCGHVYHQPCIQNWLTMNRTCPVCRADAITGDQQDVSAATRPTALSHFI